MEEKQLEDDLSQAIEEDMQIKQIAAKLAPREPPTIMDRLRSNTFNMPQEAAIQKRSMVPVEHFAESLGTLAKALEDLKSLRNRLIGDGTNLVSGKPGPLLSGAVDKEKPVVTVLHEQAIEVARIANEMSALAAQIRGVL